LQEAHFLLDLDMFLPDVDGVEELFLTVTSLIVPPRLSLELTAEGTILVSVEESQLLWWV
jgi:hypothetical protein